MTKLRIVSVLAAAVLAMALFAAVASAQGVTIFTGTVTLGGAAAPAGTAVNVTLQDGTVIGTGTTGAGGLAADQYRIDIQATAALENQTVNVNAVGNSQTVQATAVFNANRVLTVNLDAVGGSVTAATALAPLEAVAGRLELASSFNYTTALYEAYVPGLAGNILATIQPNTVIFITVTVDTTVVVSGVTFNVRANTPTSLPVGGSVTITVKV